MNKRIKKKHSPKPCPVCGDAIKEVRYSYFYSAWYVGCRRFGCKSLYHIFGRRKKDVIRAWNKYAKKNRRKADGKDG